MINKYKKISIIYGGSGVDCARRINERLIELHEKRLYPLKSNIVANEILDGTNIFQTVRKAISASSLCIIILTFDDVDGTRIRQNVLVELGMALMAVSHTDKCIFLSEKIPLPEDFPSDLKGWINPNYFDKLNPDATIEKVCNEVKKLLGCKSHKDILSSRTYFYDHEHVLDDIPNSVFEEKADIQLEHILDCWSNSVSSFDFVSERIMYMAERIKFLPDFNSNDKFFAFLAKIRTLIRPGEQDCSFEDVAYVNAACALIDTILEYTDVKLRKSAIKCLDNPDEDRHLTEEYIGVFNSIVYRLQNFVEKIESQGDRYNYNWLLKILAYEYIALAKMKVINLENEYNIGKIPVLEYVIKCYNKVIELAMDYGAASTNLWLGYAQYDLTRAYEAMYRLTRDKAILESVKKYSLASIATRREWCKIHSYKGVFSNALSFEYFLVKKHELELRCDLCGYAEDTVEQMLDAVNRLDEELRQYCDTVELGRLYDMKSSLDRFHKRLIK